MESGCTLWDRKPVLLPPYKKISRGCKIIQLLASWRRGKEVFQSLRKNDTVGQCHRLTGSLFRQLSFLGGRKKIGFLDILPFL